VNKRLVIQGVDEGAGQPVVDAGGRGSVIMEGTPVSEYTQIIISSGIMFWWTMVLQASAFIIQVIMP
jgi:hypothetical protein